MHLLRYISQQVETGVDIEAALVVAETGVYVEAALVVVETGVDIEAALVVAETGVDIVWGVFYFSPPLETAWVN